MYYGVVQQVREHHNDLIAAHGIHGHEEPIVGEGFHAEVEHTCHELAHAFLLGIDVRYERTVSARVGDMLSLMHPDLAFENEARAFAVCERVRLELGLNIDFDSMWDGMDFQMNEYRGDWLVMSKGKLRSWSRTAWARGYADMVIRFLRGQTL